MNNVTKKKHATREMLKKVLVEKELKDGKIVTASEVETIASNYNLPCSYSFVNKTLNQLLEEGILNRRRLTSIGKGAGRYFYYLKNSTADVSKYLEDHAKELENSLLEKIGEVKPSSIEEPDELKVLEGLRKEREEREEQYINEGESTRINYGQANPYPRMGSQPPFQFREQGHNRSQSDLTNITPSDVQVTVRIGGQDISETALNAMLALTDLMNSQFRLPLYALEVIQYVIEGRTYSIHSIMTIVKTYRRHAPRQPHRF